MKKYEVSYIVKITGETKIQKNFMATSDMDAKLKFNKVYGTIGTAFGARLQK